MQGTRVRSLLWEDCPCREAVEQLYWARALEPGSCEERNPSALEPASCNSWACAPRACALLQEKPPQREVGLRNQE